LCLCRSIADPRDDVVSIGPLDWNSVTRERIIMDPKTLRYAKSHEWAYLEGDVCTVGLTKFAVDQLTDIIYIDMPDVDDPVAAGDSFGEIESVKAVSDLYAPVSGDIVAVNEKLETDPTMISGDPFGKGWLIKIKVEKGTTLDHLMTLEKYEKQIASEEH
jgi:glycine cleavage system H protein